MSWLVVGAGTETWTAQENGFKSVSANTSGISQGDKAASFVAEQSGSATLTFTGSASGGGTSSLTVYKLNAFGNRDTVYSRSFYNVSGQTGSINLGVTAGTTYILGGYAARGSLGNPVAYGNVSATLSYPAMVSVTKTATRSNSGSGSGQVTASDGDKNLGGFFATPATAQGGSLSGVTYVVSANHPHVQVFFSDTRSTTTANPGATILARTLPPPVVTTQPASQALSTGAGFTLNVAATGDGTLSYQWHLNGSLIPGSTSPTYQVAAVGPANAGDYFAVVSNPVGIVASAIATVTVRTPPVFTPVGDKVVNESETIAFNVSATSADASANSSTYAFEGGVPVGAQLSTGGAFSFTPTEAQGPATNVITVRATDTGNPPLSSTLSFTLVVKEVNVAPKLTLPTNYFAVDEGQSLSFSVGARDADRPENALAFSLSNAPTGMTIDAAGTVRWPAASSLA